MSVLPPLAYFLGHDKLKLADARTLPKVNEDETNATPSTCQVKRLYKEAIEYLSQVARMLTPVLIL